MVVTRDHVTTEVVKYFVTLSDKENDGSQMLVILLVSTFLSGAALVVVGTTIYIARRRKVRIEQAEPVWMALECVPPGLNGELGYVRAMNSVYDSAKFDIPVQHLRLGKLPISNYRNLSPELRPVGGWLTLQTLVECLDKANLD